MSDPSFDTPDVDEVYQQDDPSGETVSVTVENVVRTDQMPAHTFFRNTVWPGSGEAEKILNADPRRRRAVIWISTASASGQGLCIATTRNDAQAFAGAILISINAVTRFEFTGQTELYARGASWAIPFTGYSVETDDIIINMAIEQWSR